MDSGLNDPGWNQLAVALCCVLGQKIHVLNSKSAILYPAV